MIHSERIWEVRRQPTNFGYEYEKLTREDKQFLPRGKSRSRQLQARNSERVRGVTHRPHARSECVCSEFFEWVVFEWVGGSLSKTRVPAAASVVVNRWTTLSLADSEYRRAEWNSAKYLISPLEGKSETKHGQHRPRSFISRTPTLS